MKNKEIKKDPKDKIVTLVKKEPLSDNKIRLTNGEIMGRTGNIISVLMKIASSDPGIHKMPAKIRYWIGRVVEIVNQIIPNIEKTRIASLEAVCIKGEDGKPDMKVVMRGVKNAEGEIVFEPQPGPDGNPLREYQFPSSEVEAAFYKDLDDLLLEINTLPFDRIQVNMGEFSPELLTSIEMITIEKVIEWKVIE